MKRRLIFLAQLATGIGLIVWIVLRMRANGNLDKLADALRTAGGNWPFLALGFACYGICFMLCAWRWNTLLRAQGLRISGGRVLVLYFIGHFFNSFMPGATGGDLVKAYYASKESTHKKTEIVATVFIDRLVGLLSMIGMMAVIMTLRFRFFMEHRETRVAMAFNVALLVGAIVGLAIMLHRDLLERWKVFSVFDEKGKIGGIVRRAYDAFHICLSHRDVFAKTIALSMINQIMFVVCSCLLGTALGIQLSFWDYLMVVPTISAVTCIPLTPSGLGTREGATIYLFLAFGVVQAYAFMLSILVDCALLLWGAIGGVIYLVYSYNSGRITSDESEALIS